MVITLGLTVFVDLLTAVAIGLIAAGMAHGRQLQGLELDSVVSVPMLDRTFFAGRPQLLTGTPTRRAWVWSRCGAASPWRRPTSWSG